MSTANQLIVPRPSNSWRYIVVRRSCLYVCLLRLCS